MVKMSGRVTSRRAVTATDVTAGQAEAEVNPGRTEFRHSSHPKSGEAGRARSHVHKSLCNSRRAPPFQSVQSHPVSTLSADARSQLGVGRGVPLSKSPLCVAGEARARQVVCSVLGARASSGASRRASWIIKTSARLSAVTSPTTLAVLHHGQSVTIAVLQPGEGGLQHLLRVDRDEVPSHDLPDTGLGTELRQRGGQVVDA